jgi:polyisoprenoid-binding protein YceI
MRPLAIILLLMIAGFAANAQKYITRNGYIGIYSHTPLEEIKADNNQVAGALDTATGDMVFQVLIKSFHFERALMEEHFNENFMESEKYPKSTFKGKITNLPAINFTKTGKYDALVEGDLMIHNVTRRVSIHGTIEVTTDGINGDAKFNIVPEDYKIEIPGVIRDKIDKNLQVTVAMKYTPVEN